MELSVNQLCDRYGIKSRKSLYTRLDGLRAKGINANLPKKNNKSYATEEQILFLDQLDEHLKNGGAIKNFVPTKLAEVTVHDTTTQHNEIVDLPIVSAATQHDTQLTTQLSYDKKLLGDIVTAATTAIADKMQTPDPLWYMGRLECAIASQWQLKTSEVKQLIGVKPRGETFKHGCFIFSKCGKINRESAWRVSKETDNNSSKL